MMYYVEVWKNVMDKRGKRIIRQVKAGMFGPYDSGVACEVAETLMKDVSLVAVVRGVP